MLGVLSLAINEALRKSALFFETFEHWYKKQYHFYQLEMET